MWDRLISCPVTDPDQASKGRLLNGLLAIIIPLASLNGLLFLTLLGLTMTGLVVLVCSAAFVACYVLGRRGLVTAGAAGMVLVFVAGATSVALATPGPLGAAAVVGVFILPIALSGIFFFWRAVVAVTALTTSLSVWLYLAGLAALANERASNLPDTIQATSVTFSVLVAASGVAALSSLQIAQSLTRLRQRAAELEAANRELAAQNQRERLVRASIEGLAGQLAAVSDRQLVGVANQAGAIHEVASAMDELATTATQIAGAAREVRGAADGVLQGVQEAQALVDGSGAAVARNRSEIETVIGRMAEMDRATTRLLELMSAIRGLAEETQLLALNARIEASGAGTLGRRFGVVATEVQALADRSNGLVSEVGAMLAEVRSGAKITLAATESTHAVAVEVTARATEVHTALSHVAAAVQNAVDLVHQIAQATLQQTAATQQVTQTMGDLAQVSDATRQDSAALHHVIRELSEAALLLQRAGLTSQAPAA